MIARLMIDSPQYVIAVDPGMSGAVAALGRGDLTILRDFKRHRDIVEAVAEFNRAEPDLLVIEDVHAMPGQGVVSMFSFGHATGVARGALMATFPDLKLKKVAPLRWQNFIRTIAEWGKPREFDSRAIAQQLFPSRRSLFARKKDHNSADAALMALWGLYQLDSADPVHRAD